jgi:purine nucleosidase
LHSLIEAVKKGIASAKWNRGKRRKPVWIRSLAILFWIVVAGGCQEPVPIILDTDIGGDIDDALALALALQSPEIDVRAVTTVSDDTESRARVAWKELGMYGRHEVSLGVGAEEPILEARSNRPVPAQFKVLTPQDTLPAAARQRAVDLIIRTLLASPKKLTLVPVGPLTNIALALKTEPRIKEKIERIVLMGGSFDLLVPEYNINRDHIASAIVFSSQVPITAVGLDVTLNCKLAGADLERLRKADNPAPRFLMRLIELWQGGRADRYPTLHDPLAVAVAFLPSLVETQLGWVEVEISGTTATRGLTVFTPAEEMPGRYMPLFPLSTRLPSDIPATTRVAKQVNVRRFLDLFVERLASPPRRQR